MLTLILAFKNDNHYPIMAFKSKARFYISVIFYLNIKVFGILKNRYPKKLYRVPLSGKVIIKTLITYAKVHFGGFYSQARALVIGLKIILIFK